MNLSGENLQTCRSYFFLNYVKPHTVPSKSNFPRNNDLLYKNKSELHFQPALFCTQVKTLSTNKQLLFSSPLINGISQQNTPQTISELQNKTFFFCEMFEKFSIVNWEYAFL